MKRQNGEENDEQSLTEDGKKYYYNKTTNQLGIFLLSLERTCYFKKEWTLPEEFLWQFEEQDNNNNDNNGGKDAQN